MKCACNPEAREVCMHHFDLDAYILAVALVGDNEQETSESVIQHDQQIGH